VAVPSMVLIRFQHNRAAMSWPEAIPPMRGNHSIAMTYELFWLSAITWQSSVWDSVPVLCWSPEDTQLKSALLLVTLERSKMKSFPNLSDQPMASSSHVVEKFLVWGRFALR
jgi:hypothetical protein